MNIQKAKEKFMPMSETMLYILLSLKSEMHGYAIMQNVESMTNGRITLGAGTAYQSLGKLEKGELIRCVKEENRRKIYIITDLGMAILKEEQKRIEEIYRNMEALL
ncbi:MAG: PadR family transcriptional regulator [Eubacteriales bacterium]